MNVMKVECECSINKSNVNDFVSSLFIVTTIKLHHDQFVGHNFSTVYIITFIY